MQALSFLTYFVENSYESIQIGMELDLKVHINFSLYMVCYS